MSNPKILIADDYHFNITLVKEMLANQGFEFIDAHDGQEAIELAFSEVPNLIILDWTMPKMDGLEVLKFLKGENELKHIPVIMITGKILSPENFNYALAEGAIDFIRKPINRMELLSRVKSMLLLSFSMLELKEKYEIIENSNKFIKAIFDKIPHPLVYYSPEGEIILHNHEFRLLITKEKDSLIGETIYQYLAGGEEEIHIKTDKEVLEKKEKVTYEYLVGSEKKIYLFTKNVFYNVHGETEGVICLLTNITELKNAHELIIENKKKELTSSTLKLIQTTEQRNQLIGQLNNVGTYSNKRGKELLRLIIKQLGNFSGEGFWKEFEIRFENVYESFYKELNRKFPDLTPGEKKLCALLRLSLTTKDISAITFQNPQSIDVARYRLRKKLNLSQDENLVDFLSKIG
jgi:PAS domain S-box-containing protein